MAKPSGEPPVPRRKTGRGRIATVAAAVAAGAAVIVASTALVVSHLVGGAAPARPAGPSSTPRGPSVSAPSRPGASTASQVPQQASPSEVDYQNQNGVITVDVKFKPGSVTQVSQVQGAIVNAFTKVESKVSENWTEAVVVNVTIPGLGAEAEKAAIQDIATQAVPAILGYNAGVTAHSLIITLNGKTAYNQPAPSAPSTSAAPSQPTAAVSSQPSSAATAPPGPQSVMVAEISGIDPAAGLPAIKGTPEIVSVGDGSVGAAAKAALAELGKPEGWLLAQLIDVGAQPAPSDPAITRLVEAIAGDMNAKQGQGITEVTVNSVSKGSGALGVYNAISPAELKKVSELLGKVGLKGTSSNDKTTITISRANKSTNLLG